MAFPCFDEPSFKANFSVRIRRTSEHISLSNMPLVSAARRLLAARAQMCVLGKALPCFIWDFQAKTVEVHSGLFEDHFHPSVTMSTYLVAFIICDFKSVTATTSSGVQVFLTKFSRLRSYTPRALAHVREPMCVCRCPSTPVLRSGRKPPTLWKWLSKWWIFMRNTSISPILYQSKVLF